MGDTFDISINNKEIDNPGLIIKSKFKNIYRNYKKI